MRRHREREGDRGSQDKAGLPLGRPLQLMSGSGAGGLGLLERQECALVVLKSGIWVFFFKQTVFFPDFIMS